MEGRLIRKAKKLSKYILIEPAIGEGTYGKVYLCFEETNLQKPLACKCLDIDYYNGNPVFIKKLKEELKLSRNLSHPNIVRLLDLKRTKKYLYMILDYVNGDNLDSFFQKYQMAFNQMPSLNLIKYLITDVIFGMHYLGLRNVVHRDIKLENLMFHFVDYRKECNSPKFEVNEEDCNNQELFIDFNNISIDKSELLINFKPLKSAEIVSEEIIKEQIKIYNNCHSWSNSREIEHLIMNTQSKIIDFGLGKDLNLSEGITGSVCGSPLTIAPEIWHNKIYKQDKKSYDYKVDIWSLGCCIFQMVTGNAPFEGDVDKICYKLFNSGLYYLPISNRQTTNNLTVEFIDLLNGLLQFEKENRLSWEEVVDHPFLNSPLSYQIKFTDLISQLDSKIENHKELLDKITFDTKIGSVLVLSVKDKLNLLPFAKQLLTMKSIEPKLFKSKLTFIEPINDYFGSAENEITSDRKDSDFINKVFSQEEELKDFEFEFEEIEGGFLKVDKIIRKTSL